MIPITPSPRNIPGDLLFAIKVVYDVCEYTCAQILPEAESSEYNACTFTLNNRSVKFRSAKITPTKVGQFVTLWKRNEAGITQPHDDSDEVEIYIISTTQNDLRGQFIFPKSALIKHGILSTLKKEGKRGFRVYPPWSITDNKQAQKTQQWQLDYFLETGSGISLDITRAKLLYAGT